MDHVVGFRHVAGGTEPVRWTQHGGLQGLGNIAGYVLGAGTAPAPMAPSSSVVAILLRRGEMAYPLDARRRISAMEHFSKRRVEAERMPCPLTATSSWERLSTIPAAALHFAGRRRADLSIWESCPATPVVLLTLFRPMARLSWDRASQRRAKHSAGRERPAWSIWGLCLAAVARRAFGASADGSIIVGLSHGEFGLEAFVWDAIPRNAQCAATTFERDRLGRESSSLEAPVGNGGVARRLCDRRYRNQPRWQSRGVDLAIRARGLRPTRPDT